MNRFYYLLNILTLSLLLTNIPVKAKAITDDSRNTLINTRTNYISENSLSSNITKPLNEVDASENTSPDKTQAKIHIIKFIFVGNTVIRTEDLNRRTNKYLNKYIGIKELQEARDSVTTLYREKGFTTSRAKLLPLLVNQNLSASTANITINIIEGKVEKIIYEGSPRLHKYVVERLKQATMPIMNEFKILKALRLLQKDPLIKSISAQQTLGSKSSSSILSVKVKENNPFSAIVTLNNNRSPAVGELERGVSLEDRNLLGNGDTFKFSYFNTDGSNKEIISYTSPFNSSNGTIQFSITNSDNKIIETPFNLLDINTSARAYDLVVRQPVFSFASETISKEFALGLIASRVEAQSALLGNPYPLSPGSDRNGNTRLNVLRFFQEYSQRSNINALYIRSQFNFGLGILDANINPVDPDSRFFVWQGSINWQRLLPHNFILKGRSTVQIADRHIPSLEQLVISGSNTVRGYREDSIITDSGLLASLEISYPLYTGSFGTLYIGPFIDSGATWDNLSYASSQLIASIGIGVEFNFKSMLSVHIDAAYPLVTLTAPEKTWLGNTLSFQLNYRF